MNILCIIEDLGPGGAQRQLVNFSVWLKGKGHEVSFLTFFYKGFYLETLKDTGINHSCLPIKNPLKRIIRFRRFIRSGHYDAVVAFLGVPAFLAEMAAIPSRNWKLIIGERSANPNILKSTRGRFLRFFHLFANHIVANSQTNIDLVRKVNPLLSDKQCHIIYNAIDLQLYSPEKEFVFKRGGITKIVVAASYRRLKNLLGLIEAVKLLSEPEKAKLKIDWYGDKWANPNPDYILAEAEKKIAQLGLEKVFTLHPATMELPQKIKQADVVGLFSYFEGLPNAVCEGMACGKPILTTAVSDLPVFINDEINGKLCEPFNIESITEGLRFFIQKEPIDLMKMGQLNLKMAIDLFDQEKVFEQYYQLLN